MKRALPLLLVAVLALTVLAGCEKKDARVEEVRDYLRATRSSLSSFSYTSTRPDNVLTGARGSSVAVRGVVEDDFRIKARVDIDDSPGYEEVVYDDAFALRFLEPRFATQFVDKSKIGRVETDTNVAGLNVLQALQTRRWVVDPTGAPPVVRGAFDAKNVGNDPVFDAITALDYVDAAISESAGISLWSADSINPTYIPEEDSFPTPEDGSGTKRFDLVRPALPAVSAASGGQAETALPSTRNFRRMAIYVKDGRIIRVMEEVDLRSKRQREFPKYFRALLRESSAPPEVIKGIDDQLAQMSEEEQRVGLLQMLNVGLSQFGQDPVFIRSMVLDFGEAASAGEVALPGEAVTGSLALLTLSSGGLAEEGSGSGAAPTGGPGAAGTEPAGAGTGSGGTQDEGNVPDASPQPGGVDATEPVPPG